MTTAPTQTYPPAEPQGATSNLMGLIGFIGSILGFITCGVLSPIALILSVIGLFKPPRGFAIAGTIISLIGCVILLVMALGFAGMFWAVATMGDQVSFATAAELIQQEAGTVTPTDAEGQALLDAQMTNTAGWIDIPRYRRLSDTSYELTVPGEDGQFGTADDKSTTVDITVGYEVEAPDGGM